MDNLVHIRPATLEDMPTLRAFEQGIIQAERPYDITLAPDPIHYYDLKALIQSNDAEVLVALIANQIVGSGYANIVTSKPYQLFERHAYLGFMFVEPNHRGKGINQTIVAALSEWCASKGITEMRLEVYDDNTAAIRAYEKAGFKKNLVEMRLPINAPG